MRADRLVAALLVLQARGRVTARALAEELEVSVATARRDLEALSAAGIPVYPERGRGGGWQLLGGARTDLTGLSFPEMQALFQLVGPAAAVSAPAKTALRKLVRALPTSFRAPAEAAATAVHVDGARWGAARAAEPPLLGVVRDAVVARRPLAIGYGSGDVVIEPWGVVDKAGVWYVLAGTARGRRTYRLDRMRSAAAQEGSFELPDGFDLAAEWERTTAELEARRSGASAEVTLPTVLVPALRDVLGARHLTELGIEGDRTVLRVTSNTPEMLARQLAGWFPELELRGADEVRAALRAIGASLVALDAAS